MSNLTLRRRKGPGTAGDLVAISEPNIILIDSESSNVTRIGTWSRVEESEAVGGSYLQSNTANSKLTFSFKGSTLWIRFRFGPDCGKVKVEVDSLSVTIDLYYALELYKYVNVAVGLKENETHTVTLTVLGEKNASSTDYYVKVDSFAYRLTEEALSLHSIEYIDLINVINTINRINQIELIDELSTINTINTIKNVKSIYHLAGRSLTSLIDNGSFESGDLTGWSKANVYSPVTPDFGTITVTNERCWDGEYSAKIETTDEINYPPMLWQKVSISTDEVDFIRLYWYGEANTSFELKIMYDDNSSQEFSNTMGLIPSWTALVATNFDKGKRISWIGVHPKPLEEVNANKTFYVDAITIVPKKNPLNSPASTTKYLPLTSISAGGTLDVWVPEPGKKIRLKRFQISVSGATGITLQWSGATSVTDFEHYVLPDKGTVVVNLVGCNEVAPEADAVLRIKSSASAFVTCKASGDEIY